MTRPDGLSTVPVLGGETLSSELTHELLSIQVDLLKHGLPDPSSIMSHLQSSSLGSEKDKDKLQETGEEYMATPVFIHTKLRDEDLSPQSFEQMRNVLAQYFCSSSFSRSTWKDHISFPKSQDTGVDPIVLDFWCLGETITPWNFTMKAVILCCGELGITFCQWHALHFQELCLNGTG